MRYPAWRGIPIIGRTMKAEEEMTRLGIYDFQLEELLKRSFPCERSKRKKGVHKRCITKKNKVLKIVLEEMTSRSGNKYWRIRHVGLFTMKRKRFR
ncbi:MAG: hypothetical protein ISS48_01640 [Candidatus Aenigmarchaeota archaeon]|nr:hypothetical protein [Candidatus Aenigmarchaeota archaeon]